MVYSCVGTPTTEKDETGQKTIVYLTRCRRVMQLLLSDHPSSLGLHPAVYFYSWTGKQQPVLFLVVAQMFIEYDQGRKLPEFISIRQALEDFLVSNRALVSLVVRKFFTKSSCHAYLGLFYKQVFLLLYRLSSAQKVVDVITSYPIYSYLQPSVSLYLYKPVTIFSIQVKSVVAMRELLLLSPICSICFFIVPSLSLSIYHYTSIHYFFTLHPSYSHISHPFCYSF